MKNKKYYNAGTVSKLHRKSLPKGKSEAVKSKDRHHNGHEKKDKRTYNDLQNILQKTNDRARKQIKSIPLTHIYMIAQFPVLMQALKYKNVERPKPPLLVK